ncbi:hypothetical protein BKA70DRAFT_1487521 [Coprinopsis sp. MPI-PUGE-AT-0042]|nr:hypothetical protein BKA70DRAFT_1487521 [Coprinopsis sp. MPI-PUGE-AT-0042]
MSDDEYDNLFDDFSNISGADWDAILPARASVLATNQSSGETHAQDQAANGAEEVPREVRPSPSSESDNYFGDDEVLDSSFLAAVDAIEHAATQPAHTGPSRDESQRRASTSSLPPKNDQHQQRGAFSSNLKRERSASPFVTSKKGKAKAIEEELYSASDTKLIRKLEEEFQCPVCFDILAASHIANPCGHSFCGSCGWEWIIDQNHSSCPVCRTTIARSNKMVPNVSLDSTIDKYVELLGLAGITEWRKGSGKSYIEWVARKEAWKSEVAKRAKGKTSAPTRTRAPRQPQAIFYVDEEDGPYEDDMDFAQRIINLIPRRLSNRTSSRNSGPS